MSKIFYCQREMSKNSGNIDVITETGDLIVPRCPHGPALLFSRFDQTSSSDRKFFACSAFRDRKACPFFQWTDVAHGPQLGQDRRCLRVPELWPTLNHKEIMKRFSQFKKQKEAARQMCIDCGLLLLPGETEVHEGQGHKIRSPVGNEMLDKPSQLFLPLEDNKTFAQYLFSKKTVDFILEQLSSMGVTKVLTVGCPRIHEAIQELQKRSHDVKLDSLLLDLDHRYLQVFSSEKFCRYNMLNHHFFGDDQDIRTFTDFILEGEKEHVAMVIDPPFGIMVEALCVTIEKIQRLWKSQCTGMQDESSVMPVFWFFPYFMEPRLVQTASTFTMLDYKVDYDNHELFRGDKGRKKGSPVRIFTNMPASRITLPKEEGYWYCSKCERYSFSDNRHCDKCNTCTTKDGSSYRHCNKCKRCVKPSRVHCDTCNCCDLESHKCSSTKGKGCHICGDFGHKRRECPQRAEVKGQHARSQTGSRKRTAEASWKKTKQGKKRKKTEGIMP